MAGQIRLSPEELRGRAREFKTQGDAFHDVIKNMDGLLNCLQDEWEGESSAAFKSQFDELRPSFVKVQELIVDISEQLEATGNALENLDRDIASKMRG